MQSFELRVEDVPSQQALINFAVSLQDSNQWLVPLVTLTIQFPVSWCIRPHCSMELNGSEMPSTGITLCSICRGQLSSWLSEPPGSAAEVRGGTANMQLCCFCAEAGCLCTSGQSLHFKALKSKPQLCLQQLILDIDQAVFLHLLPEDCAVTSHVLPVQELAAHIDQAAVLQGLVVDGQQGLAERWAATLAHGQQVALVAFCMEVDRLKEAVRLVKRLRLQQVGAEGRPAGVCTAFGV